MKSQYQDDFQRELKRPEDGGLTEKHIITAYRAITEEKAEELKTMPALDAIRMFKDLLLRLV